MSSSPSYPPVALLIIDVINDFDFPEGEMLIEQSLPIAPHIANLKKRAKEKGIPVIYVNDNFGKWQSDKHKLVDYCLGERGKEFVEQLTPEEDDFFIIKPMHSAFFSTPLSTLLHDMKITSLIMTGVAGNICVLFSANDAFMRDFTLYIPEDCSASNIAEDNERAILLMKNTLSADITKENELDLEKIIKEAEENKKRTMF
ncbi:isochorismatase family cysteine hydrolase [Fictibacillus enclensis]|uniref:cysteine hydrolase family protein n=1 Tax=Fictibacillus enclensis TaxID=1017270 RepID=UPI0024C02DCA|nr:isochorismatase family cysteine hydrolase [Fictibacillus enclensis]MDM5335928.1 isochorismatase family cysteine hydrolase [Fictibacillus enclensis]WHY72426.1 isochorismatase family cysteine hydrolase [Fictibacillus enclensis]